ncbi:unnamed protein product [Cuscuta europaea]|uniref:non-specific serine/threonine protein kinase n=1 Tax=Cuscuta europaea TaxID=41803 RepID=A0A9P0Z9V0_CUSEU|nr:unnamed protein product [Cuscuta europaea]
MLPPKSDLRASSMPHMLAPSERVIVAVKAEKVIAKAALAWALSHVARPGDCITLLAVVPQQKTERKWFWGFPKLNGDRRRDLVNSADRICQITDSCSQMVLQFNDQIDVRVRIKVVSATFAGAVAAEAKSIGASWVILDKKLKHELKVCVEGLRCNVVVIKAGSHPKVLRLNLGCADEWPPQTPFFSAHSSPLLDHLNAHGYSQRMKHSTPVSSPEDPTSPLYNMRTAPPQNLSVLLCQHNPLYEGPNNNKNTGRFYKESDFERGRGTKAMDSVGEKVVTLSSRSGIREAVSLGSKVSSKPPPLCSICQLNAPSFGKPPREFPYEELEEATDGFSSKTFLAEGRVGLVHKGILKDGVVVAVKQLKFLGSQADADFSREVRVLSCAQHRNVVLLIGFCIQRSRMLLVYEYICHKSLDFHLHGNSGKAPDWPSRLKIATGTARGLRYLHEDCRVGCIVHRDLRPKNILLTHDFEPLVTDFGLARFHSEWDFSDDKHHPGTSGYLAPEFFTHGKVTEKVDIYAFGLVLLELITGKRTSDFLLYHKWKNILLGNHYYPSAKVDPIHILAYKHQLLDSNLASTQLQNLPREVHAMGFAASLCLQREPHMRPPMSKVIRVLEGGAAILPPDLDSNLDSDRSRVPESRRHCRRLSY